MTYNFWFQIQVKPHLPCILMTNARTHNIWSCNINWSNKHFIFLDNIFAQFIDLKVNVHLFCDFFKLFDFQHFKRKSTKCPTTNPRCWCLNKRKTVKDNLVLFLSTDVVYLGFCLRPKSSISDYWSSYKVKERSCSFWNEV